MKDEISVNNDSIEKIMDFAIDEAEIQSHDEEDRNSNVKNNNINKSFKRKGSNLRRKLYRSYKIQG